MQSDTMTVTPLGTRRSGAPTLIIIGAVVVGVITIAQFALGLASTEVAALTLAQMLLLILLGVPVGFAMLIAGILGTSALFGMQTTVSLSTTVTHSTASSWSLSVLPMFILMGLLLWKSGATTRVYNASRVLMGRTPGNLAMTTTAAGAGLATVSGSTLGITYALARIGLPEMMKAGYSTRLATGSIAVSGLAGQLIPPSLLLVIYSGLSGTPVGPQLLAGIFPGVLLVVAFMATILVVALVKKDAAPRGETIQGTLWEKTKIVIHAWPVPLVMVIVIAGMYLGFFTATEAGSVGALIALLLLLFGRETRSRSLPEVVASLRETIVSTGSIMALLMGANLIGKLMIMSGLGAMLSNWIGGLGLSQDGLLLLILAVLIVLGMFLESVAIMSLMVPLLAPILLTYQVDMIWFGIFLVIAVELALITPPVGIVLFVLHRIAKDPLVSNGRRVELRDIFLGAAYFLPGAVLLCVLLIFFPEIALIVLESSNAE